jgi:nucleoside-diphosphate-sugar epimerase
MTRVLVTGAGGFVGRCIAEGLGRRGLEVHGISTSGGHVEPACVHWHRGDLMQPGVADRVLSAVCASACGTDPASARQR